MMDAHDEVNRLAALYRADPAPRIPPQSVQAEQAVLGGLLLDPSAWPKVADVLNVEDFYREDHRLIYRAITALAQRGKPFDAVTVGDFLQSRGHGDAVDGGGYVLHLAANTASAVNIAAHADIVAGRARLRSAIDAGTSLVDACFEAGEREPDEIISEYVRMLTELQPTAAGGAKEMRESLSDWLDQHQRLCKSKSGVTGLPTQWAGFNRVTHGLQPATAYVVAGRPSMGKSVFALNLALFSALRGTETLLFSLEMSTADCQMRNVSSLGEIPFDWLLAAGTHHDDADIFDAKLPELVQQMRRATLRIDDTPSVTVRQFEARALRQHQKRPLGLVVVDHMHDFRIDPKLARFEYGEIVQAGKRIAKQLNIPVVIFAQLNRNLSGRADKRPTLTDLRESGEIEQKADVICFLHREDYYDTPDNQTHLQGVVEMHFAKGRNVKAGERIYFKNRMDIMRLDDWSGALPERPEEAPKRNSAGFSARGATW